MSYGFAFILGMFTSVVLILVVGMVTFIKDH